MRASSIGQFHEKSVNAKSVKEKGAYLADLLIERCSAVDRKVCSVYVTVDIFILDTSRVRYVKYPRNEMLTSLSLCYVFGVRLRLIMSQEMWSMHPYKCCLLKVLYEPQADNKLRILIRDVDQ